MNYILSKLFVIFVKTVPPNPAPPSNNTFGDAVRTTQGSLNEALKWIPVLNLADFTGFKGFVLAIGLLAMFFAFISAIIQVFIGLGRVARAGNKPEKKKEAWDSVLGAGRLAMVLLALPLILAVVIIGLSVIATRS